MSTVNEVFAASTITNYGKRIVDGVTQHNPFWSLLKEKGKIERNVSGDAFTWNLEAGRHDVHVTSDDQDVSELYTPRARWKRPQLDWGQISSFRRFSKGILRQNAGKEALVKIRDREIPAMYRDAIFNTNGLHHQILNVAGASYTGNGLTMYGLPSLFSAVTWSDSLKEGVIGTGSTYAGLPLSRSGLAGQVDGAEPDSWTPNAINTTSYAWAGGTGAQTFRDNAFEILTYALSRTDRFANNDTSKRASLILLTQAMFTDLGYRIEGKQTYFISKKVGEGESQGLGSNTDMLYHGGRPVVWDENLPADTGYALIMDMLGFSMQPKAEWGKVADSGMATDGEDSDWFELDLDYNHARRSLLASITLPGQFRIDSPRGVTQLYAGA